MKLLCNLKTVAYQGIIFPKENITNKKQLISEIHRRKLRFNNHIHSFSHGNLKNQTAVSKHFGEEKIKCLTLEIQWCVLKTSNTPSYFDGRYNLCLEVNIQIMLYPDPGYLLHPRWDLIATCRHRNKSKL